MKTIYFVILLLITSGCRAQGFDQLLFQELQEKVKDNHYPKIDAIIVDHKGDIILEEYFNGFDTDRKHDMRSAFKSVTSLLTGIAIDKNLLALDDRLERFFPELQNTNKGKISVQNLLEMRSGLNCEEFYGIGPDCEDDMAETKDWVGYCLAVDLIRKPGLNWSYNSNDPMIVGEVIARASGMSVMDFARLYLFQPLGMEGYEWTVSPNGQGMTAGSFFIKPRDMLKIIKLVSDKGTWKGNRIVSEEWIAKSTHAKLIIDYSFARYARISNATYQSARYGFYWYREQLKYGSIDTEVLFASGNGGQYMMHVPAYELTVVFTGSNYGNWRGKLPFEILLQYLIPAVDMPGKQQ